MTADGYTEDMKTLPLLASLALLAAQTQAQTVLAERGAILAEIDSWRRDQLVQVFPPDPLTTEFEKPLDDIEGNIKAAQSADDLDQPRKDFKTWQHDLLIKKFILTKSAAATRTFEVQNGRIFQARLTQTAAGTDGRAGQFFDGIMTNYSAVETSADHRWVSAAINAPASTLGPRISPAPLPAPTAKALPLASLRDHLDRSGISDAVVKSMETIKNRVAGVGNLLSGFAGSCYFGVKWMMIKTHMLSPEVQAPNQIGKIGIGSGKACMMSQALKRTPKLQAKLHVRPLDLTTVKDVDASLIPERTLFVFDQGCAGFSDASGHIEYSLHAEKIKNLPASAFHRAGRSHGDSKPSIAPNEVLACSDGCLIHTMAYLRTYGRKGCLNAYVPVTEQAAAPRSEITVAGL